VSRGDKLSRGFAACDRNFDITLGGLHLGEILDLILSSACEAISATRNVGTNSAFALGLRKTTDNIERRL
jgi:hypothetical protein